MTGTVTFRRSPGLTMARQADRPGVLQGGGHVCARNDYRIESASGATCRVGNLQGRRGGLGGDP